MQQTTAKCDYCGAICPKDYPFQVDDDDLLVCKSCSHYDERMAEL